MLLHQLTFLYLFSSIPPFLLLVVYRRFVRLLVIRLAGCCSIRFSIRAEGEQAERTFQDVVYNRFLCQRLDGGKGSIVRIRHVYTRRGCVSRETIDSPIDISSYNFVSRIVSSSIHVPITSKVVIRCRYLIGLIHPTRGKKKRKKERKNIRTRVSIVRCVKIKNTRALSFLFLKFRCFKKM